MIHSSINFIILIFIVILFLLIISILVFDIVVMSIMYHCCNIYIEIKTVFACRYDVDSSSQQLDQHVS